VTLEEIARRVEKMTDHLDRLFHARTITQEDYDKASRDLTAWALAKLEEEKGKTDVVSIQ
jgi:hypothetical protein